MTPEEMRLLYDYNAWANRRALDSCAPLPEEQFRRDLSCSFRSVRDTLAHLMGAEWIWYERWHGRSPAALPEAEQFPNLASVRARWVEIERDIMTFVAGLTAEDLVRIHEFHTLTMGTAASPLWQSMQHLVNHSTYHRGQIAAMLRQLGAKPVSTDLIRYYRERAVGASV